MKKLLIVLALIGAYLCALVALLPARFALQFVQLPAQVQLGGVQGSLWSGSVDALRVEDIMLRQVSWRLQPLSLLRGQLAAVIEVDDHVDNILVGGAVVKTSSGQLQVDNLQLQARLTDMAAFAPQPSPLPLRGDVELTIAHFVWGQPLCTELQGQIRVQGAAVQVGREWEELGMLQAQLSCADGQVYGELDEPNDLGLSASVQASLQMAQGHFQLNPGNDAPRSVRNLISLLPEQARQQQRFSVRFQ
ncbi:type II secretion system protein N [Aliidiomarina soli]|uniref:Type II secretion system protein N n=1 Tax=Aliidiomarina soli TaxID=1928574 RepID=A0A432WCI1_9GAMM|nr:type II secretion system protein N [Aliidiomarina soli]RUO29689.1 hypothetical protein CWE14_14645 [Aliidiomarina soli]